MGGAKKGYFVGVHPIGGASQTLTGVLDKVPQLNRDEIDDVVVGCARTVNKCAKNVARLICLRAGLESVSAETINRFCSSGLQAISTVANAITAGQYKIGIGGGVACMTTCFGPFDYQAYGNPWILENYPGGHLTIGQPADNVPNHHGLPRE